MSETFNEIQAKLDAAAKSLSTIPEKIISMDCDCAHERDVIENWGRIFCCLCGKIIGKLVEYKGVKLVVEDE